MGENNKCTSCEEICLERITEILNSISGKGENINIAKFEKRVQKNRSIF